MTSLYNPIIVTGVYGSVDPEEEENQLSEEESTEENEVSEEESNTDSEEENEEDITEILEKKENPNNEKYESQVGVSDSIDYTNYLENLQSIGLSSLVLLVGGFIAICFGIGLKK